MSKKPNLQNQKWQGCAIDLHDIAAEVVNRAAAPSIYHDLHSLATNVRIPAFAQLLKRLQNPAADDSGANILHDFKSDLIEALHDWAHRSRENDQYGVYKATKKSEMEFVRHCASVVATSGEPEAHNQIEKVLAVALLGLMEGKDIEEVKTATFDVLGKYTDASRSQTKHDLKRTDAILDTGREVVNLRGVDAVNASADNLNSSACPELTAEQLGFIHALWDQGKFAGGYLENMVRAYNAKGENLESPISFAESTIARSDCYVKLEGDRTYVIYTRDITKAEYAGDKRAVKPVGRTSIMVDISGLRGDSFTPGAASAEVPTKIFVEGEQKLLAAFGVPERWKQKISNEDRSLLQAVDIGVSSASKEALVRGLAVAAMREPGISLPELGLDLDSAASSASASPLRSTSPSSESPSASSPTSMSKSRSGSGASTPSPRPQEKKSFFRDLIDRFNTPPTTPAHVLAAAKKAGDSAREHRADEGAAAGMPAKTPSSKTPQKGRGWAP
jgi:hypothetical protein